MSGSTLTPSTHQPFNADPQGNPSSATARAVDIEERPGWAVSGWIGVGAVIILLGLAVWLLHELLKGTTAVPPTVSGFRAFLWMLAVVGLGLAGILVAAALVVIQPVETRIVQFLGRYVGTVRRTGFSLVTPLTRRRRVSLRVRNFETRTLKVNDAAGNPVELAGIVVWQIADTARATFAVEDYDKFVTVQAEAALRHVASTHPYDDAAGEGTSLRGSTDIVAEDMAAEVRVRTHIAGIAILEVRISHLAYAAEIAQAMLQRQQASAIISARSKIVDGAVGMVEMALARLREHDIVDLDEERKAAMVSNLLVVLCGDSRATPVVNTGTLYQ